MVPQLLELQCSSAPGRARRGHCDRLLDALGRFAAIAALQVPIANVRFRGRFIPAWCTARHRPGDALLVMAAVPFSLAGGFWLIWALGHAIRVAAVGFSNFDTPDLH